MMGEEEGGGTWKEGEGEGVVADAVLEVQLLVRLPLLLLHHFLPPIPASHSSLSPPPSSSAWALALQAKEGLKGGRGEEAGAEGGPLARTAGRRSP